MWHKAEFKVNKPKQPIYLFFSSKMCVMRSLEWKTINEKIFNTEWEKEWISEWSVLRCLYLTVTAQMANRTSTSNYQKKWSSLLTVMSVLILTKLREINNEYLINRLSRNSSFVSFSSCFHSEIFSWIPILSFFTHSSDNWYFYIFSAPLFYYIFIFMRCKKITGPLKTRLKDVRCKII